MFRIPSLPARAAAALVLSLAPLAALGAQSLLPRPTSTTQAGASAVMGGSGPTCGPTTTTGATASSPTSSSINCTLSGSMFVPGGPPGGGGIGGDPGGGGPGGGGTTVDVGIATISGSTSTSPFTGVSAHLGYDGYAGQQATHTGYASSTYWGYATVSGPANVFSVVLRSSATGNASAMPTGSVADAHASGSAALYAYTVDGTGTTGASLGTSSWMWTADNSGGFGSSTELLSVPFAWSAISNNVFAFYMNTQATVANTNSTSFGTASASEDALASFDAPSILLYDSQGRDVTGSHTIAYGGSYVQGTNTVATPEPASMMLIGTGLLGLVGVVRRRR